MSFVVFREHRHCLLPVQGQQPLLWGYGSLHQQMEIQMVRPSPAGSSQLSPNPWLPLDTSDTSMCWTSSSASKPGTWKHLILSQIWAENLDSRSKDEMGGHCLLHKRLVEFLSQRTVGILSLL